MPKPRQIPRKATKQDGASRKSKRARKSQLLVHGAPSVTRSIADAICIKNGNLYFVTESDGSVPIEGSHGYGLYYHDCRYLNAGPAEKRFFRQVHFSPVERTLHDFNSKVVPQKHDDRAPRNAFENIIRDGRSAYDSFADDEEIFRGPFGDMAVLIKHDRLVEARTLRIRFDECGIYIRA